MRLLAFGKKKPINGYKNKLGDLNMLGNLII